MNDDERRKSCPHNDKRSVLGVMGGDGKPVHGLPPASDEEPAWCRTCGALWCEGGLLSLFVGSGWAWHHPAADRSAPTLGNTLADAAAIKKTPQAFRGCLTDRERELLVERFGIDGMRIYGHELGEPGRLLVSVPDPTSGGGARIEYNKRDGPVTAHELRALDFLAKRDRLPPNPVTPEQLRSALGELPALLRAELRGLLAITVDEGAGIVVALSDG